LWRHLESLPALLGDIPKLAWRSQLDGERV
jgi:hypothetical protein